jgi:hypothetical protein
MPVFEKLMVEKLVVEKRTPKTLDGGAPHRWVGHGMIKTLLRLRFRRRALSS